MIHAEKRLQVPVEDGQYYEGVTLAAAEKPVQRDEGFVGSAIVDGVGEVPWSDRPRFAEIRRHVDRG